MNTEIARATNQALALPPRAHDLRMATKWVICWTPSDPTKPAGLTRSLTDDERRRIRDRIDELDRYLGARDNRAIERAITVMMLSIPSGRASGGEAEAIIAAYVHTLADLPPWAVAESAKRFSRGEVKSANPAFAPSGAEIHREASQVVAGYRAEIAKWQQVLAGVVGDQIQPISRERNVILEQERDKNDARANLRAVLTERGVDPSELDKLPDAPPRPGSFGSLR